MNTGLPEASDLDVPIIYMSVKKGVEKCRRQFS